MKNLIKKIVLCSSILMSVAFSAEASKSYQSVVVDTVLNNAQAKVEQALGGAFKTRNIDSFNALERQFNISKHNQKPYWTAYLAFYKSIYYLKMGDKTTCEKLINESISKLDKTAKTSEDFALLAYLQSFSVQFHKGMAAGFVASKVKRNAEKAIALDANNARAYFVLGSNDFYTPSAYGGGKKVEEYLTKAISVPDRKTQDSTAPTWGKDSAYEMLIKFYIKQKKGDLAKKHFADAQKLYPKSYAINDLAKQMTL